jgi:hypothetical protein
MKTKALAFLNLLTTPLLCQQGNRKGHDILEPVVPAKLVSPVSCPASTVPTSRRS